MEFWYDEISFSNFCQASKVECFGKIVNGFQRLTIFAKRSILMFETILNTLLNSMHRTIHLKTLSANPTNWSNTL